MHASAKASSEKQWNAHVFNSFIFTLLCENRKRALILSDAAAEITVGGSNFNKNGVWNKHGVAKLKILRKLIAMMSRLFGWEE